MKRPRANDGTELDHPAGPNMATYDQAQQPGASGFYNTPAAGTEAVFPCVKLRGLPFDVTEADVKMFLVRTYPAH
jgi:hypothetical protein